MARRRNRFEWYAWFPEDFHGDELVRLMTPAGRGAYRELLDHSWRVGPVVDPERCLRAWGWDPSLWESEIRCCWTSTTSGWVQRRLELERAEAKAQSDRAVAANRVRHARPNGCANARANVGPARVPLGSSPPPPPQSSELASLVRPRAAEAAGEPPKPSTRRRSTKSPEARTSAASTRVGQCIDALAAHPRLSALPGFAKFWAPMMRALALNGRRLQPSQVNAWLDLAERDPPRAAEELELAFASGSPLPGWRLKPGPAPQKPNARDRVEAALRELSQPPSLPPREPEILP